MDYIFPDWGETMSQITLELEPEVILFYSRLAASSGKTLNEVLSRALFLLAGELSLEAMEKANRDFLEKTL